jgi:hypothetical protein
MLKCDCLDRINLGLIDSDMSLLLTRFSLENVSPFEFTFFAEQVHPLLEGAAARLDRLGRGAVARAV